MDRRAVASQDEVRRHNLAALLRLVHVRGATSRADLTALTGLNRSTVRALTTELVDAGLVRESAPVGRGSAGRPSITVEPQSDRVYVVALDIGVDHLTAVQVGLGGVILARRERRQSEHDYDVTRTLRRLTDMVCDLQAAAPPGSVCVAVGVGVCGVVSSDDGVVRLAPNLGWVDVPLRALLAQSLRTSLRLEIGNDGDLGAMAEQLRGAATGLTDLVYISGEVGIGGGIIVAGRPLRGSGGYGGEIGHMSIDVQGLLCRCGRRGCWETEIGGEAVLRSTGAPAGAVLADVLAAHAAGAAWTVPGMRRVGRALGVGVANLVNVFNPQMIVFGGTCRQVYSATAPQVRAALAGALQAPRDQVHLGVSVLGDDATAVGAAELAFAPLIADPLGALAPLLADRPPLVDRPPPRRPRRPLGPSPRLLEAGAPQPSRQVPA